MKIIPTWGYKDDGSAEIFDLKEGETLPDGWDAQPKPWNHPNTAHLYVPPIISVTMSGGGSGGANAPRKRGRSRRTTNP